ncbi:MAG: amidotransferase 1, exosortase A system-associated [Gammaproteobacteria bacterium]|nr:amidotransferase 1, exosortase A system-associated [Gammaproteobacteria bacterium]
MCGISGIFDLNGSAEIDQEMLTKMNDIQSHRGPDDDGFFFAPGIGLAHRRLSIIDLSGGHQPMFNQIETIGVVFNGEIYNFKELSEELITLGHHFNTHSDTETIIHAWAEWGVECVNRFRGMFAFAVWDKVNDSLFIARDRLGIKPLYYSLLDNGQLIFGSELKVLKQHPLCPRVLDPEAIEDYFTFGYIPEPKSIFKNVKKLEPGHVILIEKGDSDIKPSQYWDVKFDQSPLEVGGNEQVLMEKFTEAVDVRLMSEVPLGAFLSGGVDSSAVVAVMSTLQDTPVNACSIGFDVAGYNETEYATEVAERYKAKHVIKQVSSDDYQLIDTLSALYDEPYADSSALPTYRLCQMAKERVTVALSGDGADELMAGYRRYKWHLNEEKVRRLLPLRFRKPVFGWLGKVYPKLDWAPRVLRAKTTFQSMSFDWVEGYHNSMSILRSDERKRLFSDSFKTSLNGYNSLEVFRKHAKNAPDEPLSQVQYLDMKTYLVGDILTKVDRASMAHSIEVRVPLLDHHFVEWAANIPASERLLLGEGKGIFKKALEPHLPHDVLYRKKMGFGVPLATWFRGPLKEQMKEGLLSDVMINSGIFNVKTLNWLIDSHVNGTRDNSAPLWMLLMFERFMISELA